MYLAVGEDGNLGIGKLVTVTEHLDAVLGTEESLRLCYIDLVLGNTAVYHNGKRSIILSKKGLYDKVLCGKLYAEAGEEAQKEPCGCTGKRRSDILA